MEDDTKKVIVIKWKYIFFLIFWHKACQCFLKSISKKENLSVNEKESAQLNSLPPGVPRPSRGRRRLRQLGQWLRPQDLHGTQYCRQEEGTQGFQSWGHRLTSGGSRWELCVYDTSWLFNSQAKPGDRRLRSDFILLSNFCPNDWVPEVEGRCTVVGKVSGPSSARPLGLTSQISHTCYIYIQWK